MLCDEPPLPRLCVYICPEGNFKSRNLHFDRPEGKNKETAANNSCTNWPVHCVSKVQSSTFRKSSSGFSFCFKPTCFAGENISAVPLKTRLGPPHLNFSMTVFPPFRLQTLVPLFVSPNQERGRSIQVQVDTEISRDSDWLTLADQISPPYRNLGRDKLDWRWGEAAFTQLYS